MSESPVRPDRPDWSLLPTVATPVRIAMIGISGYGMVYYQVVQELIAKGVVKLVAATVINPGQEVDKVRELRAAGCAVYTDYEEMLGACAGKLDLCLVPTGIPWHARMTIAALKSGANVLVEKPLAGSMADVREIMAAEKAAQRFVAVGFQDFYTPGTRWLKQQLVDGAIGDLRSVRVLGFWPRPADYYSRNGWAGRLQAQGAAVLDSPFNNAFGHFVNLALYYAGSTFSNVATAEQVEAELFRAHPIESFDTGVVRAKTVQGTTLWLGFSHACRTIADPEIFIEGTKGLAQWTYEDRCTVTTADGRVQSHALPDAFNTRRVMFAAVLRRLQEPDSSICDTTMAARHTDLIEAIHAASPIRTFPPSLVDSVQLSDNSAPIPAVRGLEATMGTACKEHRLLRELGFPAAL